MRYLCIYCARMSPAFNSSPVLQHLERGNAVEIRNGITFDFYLGLPHLLSTVTLWSYCTLEIFQYTNKVVRLADGFIEEMCQCSQKYCSGHGRCMPR